MKTPRRTKIIATLGPQSASPMVLKQMIEKGVNLVRINYSHGQHEQHLTLIQQARECAHLLNKEIGVIADLQGPKIRIGCFLKGLITLKQNQTFILDCEKTSPGDELSVGVDFKTLYQDLHQGDTVLLDDGLIEFEIEKIKQKKIICNVKTPGMLSDHKGINLKGGGLSANALTKKDFVDLKQALAAKVDYIAISFARNANDIELARKKIRAANSNAGVIAKIERAEALDYIDEIILASDAVMVARGDLGVEIGLAEVPFQQKRIIHRARALNKAVITATQMMESMIEQPQPTRAEVSDVANAIIEGTDAVMFSAETAIGKYPIKVIETVNDVALSAERRPASTTSKHRLDSCFERIDEAIAMAAMYAANHYPITAIIALTESGATPLNMSRIRSNIPIYALTRHLSAHRKMTLYRGVFPLEFDATQYDEHTLEQKAMDCVKAQKHIKKGQTIILTRGSQVGDKGETNALKILTVH